MNIQYKCISIYNLCIKRSSNAIEGNRATHKKDCMLGQLQKHKKMVSEMEVKLNDLKKELNDKQLDIDQKIKKVEEIDSFC